MTSINLVLYTRRSKLNGRYSAEDKKTHDHSPQRLSRKGNSLKVEIISSVFIEFERNVLIYRKIERYPC